MRARAPSLRVAALSMTIASVAGCAAGPPGLDQFVTVAGGQLDVWCDGGTGPTLIFVAAIGGDHSLEPTAEALQDDAYVCIYDRPGDGETEPPDRPRTARTDAEDLHELLGAVSIPTPVVLVAHSYGGLISAVAAAEHPDDIAGVVLIDSSQAEQENRFDAVLTAEQRETVAAEFANFPHIDFYTSLDEAGESYATFPDIPLTVISATRGFDSACEQNLPCNEMQAIWLDVQAELAQLTPDARHVLADTGHYVHEDDPELVITEIQALLERLEPPED